MKNRLLSLTVVAVLLISLLAGCAGSGDESSTGNEITTGAVSVIYDEEFGNIYIEPTIEEFNALGFSFGDSVDFFLTME